MVVDWVEDLLIGVHNTCTPTDAEWNEYLSLCKKQMLERDANPRLRPRQLIVTDGGGPNLEQRRRAHEVAKNANIHVAVVSASRFVRFVVNALVVTKTNAHVRAFAPDETDAAYRYLEIDDRMLPSVESCVEAVRAKLDRPAEPPKRRRFWQRRLDRSSRARRGARRRRCAAGIPRPHAAHARCRTRKGARLPLLERDKDRWAASSPRSAGAARRDRQGR
jgi:hypothetical protein